MMIRNIHSACVIAFITVVFCGCGNDESKNTAPPLTQKQVNNGLIDSHKAFLLQQEDEIKQYVQRHNYDMQRTQTGIYYKITESGKGEMAHVGEMASVSYTISLLDGTVCYDTRQEGPKQFKVG